MSERIAKGLQAQFEKHRIVFWYDPNREFRTAFDDVQMRYTLQYDNYRQADVQSRIGIPDRP